jgi:hypothetical protein
MEDHMRRVLAIDQDRDAQASGKRTGAGESLVNHLDSGGQRVCLELQIEECDYRHGCSCAYGSWLGGAHTGPVATVAPAGPLLDRTSPFRGLSILNVGVEEARALKESDPAVQAGKFAVIALPWMVPAGAMSFSPARFPRSASEALGS